jgi:hypothetical protein
MVAEKYANRNKIEKKNIVYNRLRIFLLVEKCSGLHHILYVLYLIQIKEINQFPFVLYQIQLVYITHCINFLYSPGKVGATWSSALSSQNDTSSTW